MMTHESLKGSVPVTAPARLLGQEEVDALVAQAAAEADEEDDSDDEETDEESEQ